MKANQQNNNHLQWETAFLLTLAMFPLIGIGPIVAFTVGYFFRRRSWGWNLGLMGLFVLGIQILIISSVYIMIFLAVNIFDSIPEKIFYRLFESTFCVIPIIGVIIGLVKKNKYWATLLKQVSLSCLLVVIFVYSNAYYGPLNHYSDDSFSIFTNILLGFPILFVSVCIYRYRHRWNWGVFVSCLILIIVNAIIVTTTPHFIKARYKARCEETKSNTHDIQIALNEYNIDTHGYPEDIQFLVDKGYLKEMPMNAFTGNLMRNVEFGSNDYAGNFTYLTHIVDGEVNGYYLLGYAGNMSSGKDVNEDGIGDHVTIEFYDSYPGYSWRRICDPNQEKLDKQIEDKPGREIIPLPDLKDLLNETYIDD